VGLGIWDCCYFSLKVLFGMHIAYGALFTWNILWLMADGIWITIQVAMKGPQWWRARKAFKSLGEHWTAEVVVDEWLGEVGNDRDDILKINEARGIIDRKDLERGWIEHKMDDLSLGHLYARLLRRYSPRFMDMYPYGGGAGAHIANMIRGVPVRRPWMVYPVAKEA